MKWVGHILRKEDSFLARKLNNRLWGTPKASVRWAERLQWAIDASEGMQFIHNRGYTHRDLKSPNILYERASGRAKIADFGMSRELEPGITTTTSATRGSSDSGNHEMTGEAGTPQWMAPELATNLVAIREKFRNMDAEDPRGGGAAIESFRVFLRGHEHVGYSQACSH